jgi:5'(3')-deoxyribonucleotidase
MTTNEIALIDLDATAADYDAAMRDEMQKIQAPEERPYRGRYEEGLEPPHMEARRKLIQRQVGFWRNLKPLRAGFEVVEDVVNAGFKLHVLTKGPYTSPSAWTEKLEWCHEHLPTIDVTITGDKSIVYGRVLVDDFPPYFEKWLARRPRGLVVCVAHPWNLEYATGGSKWQRNILRYDGSTSNRALLRELLRRTYEREPMQSVL